MIFAAALILVITVVTWLLIKVMPWKICPICAGVSGTWLLISAGIIWGVLSAGYKLPVAMLMGGTVVGIAFQGEKIWPWAQRSIFYWKVPVIVIGMPFAYWLFEKMSPATLLIEAALLFVITYLFFMRSKTTAAHKDDKHVSELEEKMKNCC